MENNWPIRKMRLLPDYDLFVYTIEDHPYKGNVVEITMDQFIETFSHSYRMLRCHNTLQNSHYEFISDWDKYFKAFGEISFSTFSLDIQNGGETTDTHYYGTFQKNP